MILTESNYYSQESNKGYFSVSQYKDFMKCEAMAMAKIQGSYQEPLTKALLVGSFVDAYFDNTLEKFINDNPIVFTRKKELKSEFRKANDLIQKIKSDSLFMQFMSGEKQKILTFEMFGVNWKVKIDSFIPETCITDLKTVANFNSLPYWRYDIQGAVYQAGVERNGLGRLPFYLACATKEKVIDLDIFQIPQENLDLALREVESQIKHFSNVKNGLEEPQYCGVCDYCKNVKTARIRDYNELLE